MPHLSDKSDYSTFNRNKKVPRMVSREVIESLACFGNLSFHFAAISIPMSVPSVHPHCFQFPKISCITWSPSNTLICTLSSQNRSLCCLLTVSFLNDVPNFQFWDQLLKTITIKPTVIYIETSETCLKTDLYWISYSQSLALCYDTSNPIRTDLPNHNSQNNTLTSQWRSPCSFLNRHVSSMYCAEC